MMPLTRGAVTRLVTVALGQVLFLLGGASGAEHQAFGPPSSCFESLRKYADAVPESYRLPRESDVTGYWSYFREENGAEASCVEGDLDGDGVSDYSSILIGRKSAGFAVAALLSTRASRRQFVLLLEDQGDILQPQDVRLSIVKPGSYRSFYACDVEKAPAHFNLKHVAIDYFGRQKEPRAGIVPDFKPEHWIFYWGDKTRDFRRQSLCTSDQWKR